MHPRPTRSAAQTELQICKSLLHGVGGDGRSRIWADPPPDLRRYTREQVLDKRQPPSPRRTSQGFCPPPLGLPTVVPRLWPLWGSRKPRERQLPTISLAQGWPVGHCSSSFLGVAPHWGSRQIARCPSPHRRAWEGQLWDEIMTRGFHSFGGTRVKTKECSVPSQQQPSSGGQFETKLVLQKGSSDH